MKRSLPSLLALAVFLLAGAALRAESVIATPSPAKLAPGGGEVELAVAIDYGSAPAALGLALDLPAGWSFGGVTAGATPPQIAPPAGTTEKVELAWTTAPAGGAAFTLKLAYPAGVTAETLTGRAELRRDGKRLDLQLTVPLSP